MKKVICFDIDGTLANIMHRVPFVRNKPKNWAAFNKLMHLDSPHDDIIWLFTVLSAQEDTVMIVASGRGEENREITEQWLRNNNVPFVELFMRPEKDYRADYIIKEEILEKIRQKYGEPYLWFDDRNQVVNEIRAAGVRVLQVSPGDF